MLPSLLLRKILEEGLYTAYLKESSSQFMCNVVTQHAWEMSNKMDDREKAKELREVAGQLREEIVSTSRTEVLSTILSCVNVR